MKQIKIENNGVEQLITVPENSKVTIDGSVVVFEPKFKKGDIVYSEWETTLKSENSCIGIYDSTDALFHRLFVKYLDRDDEISFNGAICEGHTLRLANIFQKANLFAKLNKEGKQWNAEKLCIEDLKVIPKVGDCVKLTRTNTFVNVLSVISEIKNGRYYYKSRVIADKIANEPGYWEIEDNTIFYVLKNDQFQSELSKLGFEYNFENDTISEIKWKPKEGEVYWHITVEFEPARQLNDNVSYDLTRINAFNCFKTSELCQQTIDKIKQVLSEK